MSQLRRAVGLKDVFFGTKSDDISVTVASEQSEPLTVETVNNHIYFYSHVDSDRALALMQKIRYLDNDLRNEFITRDLPDTHPRTPIWLHIQSGGGGLFAGLAVADQIRQIKSPIYSVIEGYCASAATLISMSCTRRLIQPSAFMLIHQLSSVAWGKYEEIKDEVHMMDMAMERLVDFYTAHSDMDEQQVKEILERESWFKASECVDLGLVDEII
jgi:ATP-dependent protease ClpP protease subunit